MNYERLSTQDETAGKLVVLCNESNHRDLTASEKAQIGGLTYSLRARARREAREALEAAQAAGRAEREALEVQEVEEAVEAAERFIEEAEEAVTLETVETVEEVVTMKAKHITKEARQKKTGEPYRIYKLDGKQIRRSESRDYVAAVLRTDNRTPVSFHSDYSRALSAAADADHLSVMRIVDVTPADRLQVIEAWVVARNERVDEIFAICKRLDVTALLGEIRPTGSSQSIASYVDAADCADELRALRELEAAAAVTVDEPDLFEVDSIAEARIRGEACEACSNEREVLDGDGESRPCPDCCRPYDDEELDAGAVDRHHKGRTWVKAAGGDETGWNNDSWTIAPSPFATGFELYWHVGTSLKIARNHDLELELIGKYDSFASAADRAAEGSLENASAADVKIGDWIVAQDFEPCPGRGVCSIEGPVVALDEEDGTIRIVVKAETILGERATDRSPFKDRKATRIGSYGLIPRRLVFDWSTRLEVISNEVIIPSISNEEIAERIEALEATLAKEGSLGHADHAKLRVLRRWRDSREVAADRARGSI
jgi:hypothetical protein